MATLHQENGTDITVVEPLEVKFVSGKNQETLGVKNKDLQFSEISDESLSSGMGQDSDTLVHYSDKVAFLAVMRVIRLLRIIRLAKLSRHSRNLNALVKELRLYILFF